MGTYAPYRALVYMGYPPVHGVLGAYGPPVLHSAHGSTAHYCCGAAATCTLCTAHYMVLLVLLLLVMLILADATVSVHTVAGAMSSVQHALCHYSVCSTSAQSCHAVHQ